VPLAGSREGTSSKTTGEGKGPLTARSGLADFAPPLRRVDRDEPPPPPPQAHKSPFSPPYSHQLRLGCWQ